MAQPPIPPTNLGPAHSQRPLLLRVAGAAPAAAAAAPAPRHDGGQQLKQPLQEHFGRQRALRQQVRQHLEGINQPVFFFHLIIYKWQREA